MNSIDKLCDELCSQSFSIVEDFLPLDVFNALSINAQAMHSNGTFRNAKIGNSRNLIENTQIRSDQISWLEQPTQNYAIMHYISAMNQLLKHFNQTFYLGLEELESHFAVYLPGTFYRKHVDQFKSNQNRRISCVYYLNSQWKEHHGGHLRLYDDKDQPFVNIAPLGNRLICFKSDLAHEVSETHHPRYSIASWMSLRNIQLIA